jgi:hypothetical protein
MLLHNELMHDILATLNFLFKLLLIRGLISLHYWFFLVLIKRIIGAEIQFNLFT